MMGSKSDDEYRQAVVKVEEVLSSIAIQIGRYIVTMMSTGVILAIGFQMSGWPSYNFSFPIEKCVEIVNWMHLYGIAGLEELSLGQ